MNKVKMIIKKLVKYSFVVILFLSLVFYLKTLSFANGGDQRVVEGKYLVNLSRSPFTPKVGDKTSMLASFVDIQKDLVIVEDLIVKVRIAKFGEGRERNFLFEQENLIAKRGILEFQYTFQDAGLHEIFFDFAFPSNPQTIYNVPDFLLDIQKSEIFQASNQPVPIWVGLGTILGFGIGWFMKQKLTK